MDTRLGIKIDPKEAEEGGRRVREEIKKIKGEAKEGFSVAEQGATAFGAAMRQLGAILGFVGVGAVLHEMSSAARGFQATIVDVGVDMDVMGNDLREITARSKEMAQGTVFTAEAIMKAAAAMEDTHPEMLQTKAAFDQLIEASILYAQAQRGDVIAVAQRLGVVLGEFKFKASEAAEAVNILAAGSTLGAERGQQLLDALADVGTVAHDVAKMSLQETIVALQLLTKGGVDAGNAGAALGLILGKLTNQTRQDFNPEVVGFTAALKNLDAAALSTTQKIDLFGGPRFLRGGEALMANAHAAEEMAKSITGTNKAMEQSVRQTSTFDAAVTKMKNAFEEVSVSLGGKLNPLVHEMTIGLTSFASSVESGGVAAKAMEMTINGLLAAFDGMKFAIQQIVSFMRQLDASFAGNVAMEAVANISKGLQFVWQEFVVMGPTNFKAGVELMLAQFSVLRAGIILWMDEMQVAWAKWIDDLAVGFTVGLGQMVNALPETLAERSGLQNIVDSLGQMTVGTMETAKALEEVVAQDQLDLDAKKDVLRTTIEVADQAHRLAKETYDAARAAHQLKTESLEEIAFNVPKLPAMEQKLEERAKMTREQLLENFKLFAVTANQNHSVMAEAIMRDYQTIEQAAMTTFTNVKDSMVDLAVAGELTFANMATSILHSIERIVLNNMFTQLFSMIAGAMFPGGALTSPGQIDASMLPPGGVDAIVNAGGHARGGSVVIPGSGGADSSLMFARVTPGEKVSFGADAQGGGRGTIVQVINSSGGQVQTRTDSSGGQDVVRVFVGKVASDIMRPTSDIHRAMRSAFGLRIPANQR
jgi:TP901 family phage tail tape measure protein